MTERDRQTSTAWSWEPETVEWCREAARKHGVVARDLLAVLRAWCAAFDANDGNPVNPSYRTIGQGLAISSDRVKRLYRVLMAEGLLREEAPEVRREREALEAQFKLPSHEGDA